MDCPYKDTLTTKVAKYITDALNSYLERYNKLYPAEKKWDKAVVGYRDYDAFDEPECGYRAQKKLVDETRWSSIRWLFPDGDGFPCKTGN